MILKINNRFDNLGQSLIELLVVIAVMALILPAITAGFIVSREGRPQQKRRQLATAMVNESHAALKSIREQSWSNFDTNGIYHTVNNGSTWSLAPGSEIIDELTNRIIISDVHRDTNHNIIDSGGYIDPSTKKILISVTWDIPLTTTVESTIYLTRYLDNATYFQSTEAEFLTGTLTGTIVTNTDDGEVALGSGGSSSWCDPSLTIAALDLPKSGVANAVTAIEGVAFAATGDNASGVAFAKINISNDSPPVATIANTFDGYKTNDVFGISGYAFLATDSNSKEIVILNTSNSPINEVGYFDASGSTDGAAIFVLGNVGYMVQGSTFRTFDLSSMNGSRPALGSVSLGDTGRALQVLGSYAYVAVDDDNNQLKIIDISNPGAPQIVGWANLATSGVSDIIVNETGTRAYISGNLSSNNNEVFIIDISTKTGSRTVIGSADTSPMNPRGLTIVPGNRMIVVGTSGEEYQVFNIAKESAPSYCGGIEVDAGIKGISSVLETDGNAYSYIITGDVSEEFKIIEGGPGGSFATSGVYESATFDASYSTAFNRLIPQSTIPSNTDLKYQIAIADPVSGSCAGVNFNFTGPDGTDQSFYLNSESIFFNDDGQNYENPARCLRYRAYLSSSDSSSTPIFESMMINYSP